MKIEIIKDTKDYLIINKPAGLLVHATSHNTEETLVDWLLKKYPSIKKVGEAVERPGIVHRLDKEVSGLMIIAKNQKAFDYFKDLFKTRKIIKEYTGIVYGQIDKDEGEIDFPIKRSSHGYKMAAVPQNFVSETDKVRKAITEFTVIKKSINYSLLNLNIKTGRTHQIRVHLSALGYPLIGDDLYGTKKSRLRNQKLKPGRIFLVARHLKFTDLNDKIIDVELELPEDLANFSQKI